MPEGFVDGDGDGAGKVEGADVVGPDGDAEDGVGAFGEQTGGEALGFATENEGVAGGEGCVVVAAGAAGAEQEEAVRAEGLGARGPGGVDGDLDGFPIIQAGPAQVGVVDREAEGFDEVEAGSGGGAKAGDVAGVGGDFGRDEDDVERGGGPAEVKMGFAGVVVFHGESRQFPRGGGERQPWEGKKGARGRSFGFLVWKRGRMGGMVRAFPMRESKREGQGDGA